MPSGVPGMPMPGGVPGSTSGQSGEQSDQNGQSGQSQSPGEQPGGTPEERSGTLVHGLHGARAPVMAVMTSSRAGTQRSTTSRSFDSSM